MYNQTKVNGAYMPLLMGCTKTSSINQNESTFPGLYYDPIRQIAQINAAQKYHSTMSQKPEITDPGHHQDWKTRQDDKKFY